LTESREKDEDLKKLDELAKQLPRRVITDENQVRFPHETIPLTDEFSGVQWEQMDKLILRASKDIRFNVFINIFVVGIGFVLLAYSMVYSWINGLDIFSTALGSFGVIEFIAVFYLKPQKGIAKSIGDTTQLQMFYRTYVIQVETLSDWLANNPEMSLGQLEIIIKRFEELTNNTTQKIQDHIGT